MRSARHPAGSPIGRALDIPSGLVYDELRQAVAAIERVHGDGDLPRIPVRLSDDLPGYGRFRFDPTTGAPISIAIRANRPYRQLALLHEVGHFLDWHSLGGGQNFASTEDPLLSDWALAVRDSAAFRQLSEIARRGAGHIDEHRIVILTPHAVLAALEALRLEELWARSYAQFVASHTSFPGLHQEMVEIRTGEPGKVYYPLQWDDGDFSPIAGAIDNLFATLGWRQ